MKLKYLNTAPLLVESAHGMQAKTLIVLHETVSPDEKGLADIEGIEHYLVEKGYGIHGMTDAEGNIAWALGLGRAIFWQAGGVNSQSIGIEQVSNIPLIVGVEAQTKAWKSRSKQLNATARLLAAICHAHGIPLEYVDGSGKFAGITTHWDVSQFFAASEGHTDCHPVTKGGYYPVESVVAQARRYSKWPYSYTF